MPLNQLFSQKNVCDNPNCNKVFYTNPRGMYDPELCPECKYPLKSGRRRDIPNIDKFNRMEAIYEKDTNRLIGELYYYQDRTKNGELIPELDDIRVAVFWMAHTGYSFIFVCDKNKVRIFDTDVTEMVDALKPDFPSCWGDVVISAKILDGSIKLYRTPNGSESECPMYTACFEMDKRL